MFSFSWQNVVFGRSCTKTHSSSSTSRLWDHQYAPTRHRGILLRCVISICDRKIALKLIRFKCIASYSLKFPTSDHGELDTLLFPACIIPERVGVSFLFWGPDLYLGSSSMALFSKLVALNLLTSPFSLLLSASMTHRRALFLRL